MIYKFTGFSLDDRQNKLSYKNKPVYLTKKSYDLLLFLIKNPAKAITREQLIAEIWDGRIVTENTLDQCISKLRKILNNEKPGEYIKSVYAQGLHFVPEVTCVKETRQSINKLWVVLPVLTLLVWLAVFSYKQLDTNHVLKPLQTLTPHITAISLLPLSSNIKDLENEDDWFKQGSQVYLKNVLGASDNIKIVAPEKNVLQSLNIENEAINLLNHKKTEIVALNDFAYDGEYYTAKSKLRNQAGILAEKDFKAVKIQALMIQLSGWLVDNVGIANHNENTDLSTDEFALGSYMHAMSAQLKGDSQKAIVFLESAVEQDPEFKQAWYELAIAFRKQGNYKKSLAILNAIDNTSNQLKYKIEMVKGHTHDGMQSYQKALKAYQLSLEYAKLMQGSQRIAAIQVSQAITYIKLKDFNNGRKLLDHALKVTNPETQAQFYGVIMNNYAKLEKANTKFSDAVKYSQHAIQAFIRSGDKSYEMLSKTRLSSLLMHLGLFSEAEELAKESLIYANGKNQLKSISSNHFKLGIIYHATGKFLQSKEHWLDALTLNIKLDSPIEKATIFDYLIDLHIDFKEQENAKNYLMQLQELSKQYPTKRILNIFNRSQFKYSLFDGDIELAQQMISKYEGEITSNMHFFLGDFALLQKKYVAAETHYLDTLKDLEKTNDNLMIVKVMNRLNKLYLQGDIINTKKASENLAQMDQYNPFAYPYQKYQAILNFHLDKKIKAVSLLHELKLKANYFWQAEDQILLEHYQAFTK